MIEIKTSPLSDGEFNRGVFATCDIKKDNLSMKHLSFLIQTTSINTLNKRYFADYAFEYGINHSAILLGYGIVV